MKVKIEMDLTPEEAKELFVPSDKQSEFMSKTYDAYIQSLNDVFMKTVNPFTPTKE